MAAKAIVAAPSVLLRDVAVLDRTGDQHNEGRLPAECLHSRLGLRVESSQEAGPSRTGSHLRRDRSDFENVAVEGSSREARADRT